MRHFLKFSFAFVLSLSSLPALAGSKSVAEWDVAVARVHRHHAVELKDIAVAFRHAKPMAVKDLSRTVARALPLKEVFAETGKILHKKIGKYDIYTMLPRGDLPTSPSVRLEERAKLFLAPKYKGRQYKGTLQIFDQERGDMRVCVTTGTPYILPNEDYFSALNARNFTFNFGNAARPLVSTKPAAAPANPLLIAPKFPVSPLSQKRFQELQADLRRLGARDLTDGNLRDRLKRRLDEVRPLLTKGSNMRLQLDALYKERDTFLKRAAGLNKAIQHSEEAITATQEKQSTSPKQRHAERLEKERAHLAALKAQKARMNQLRIGFYRKAIKLLTR